MGGRGSSSGKAAVVEVQAVQAEAHQHSRTLRTAMQR